MNRVLDDLRNRRHLEAYGLFLVVLALTVLNLLGQAPNQVTYSAILACLGFLIYRSIDFPSRQNSLDAVLLDREGLQSFSSFIENAEELCIYAPTAVNILLRHSADISDEVLSRGGKVRVVLMEPSSSHLHELNTYIATQGIDLVSALATSLSAISKLESRHNFEYRLIDFDPGFNLTIVDPRKKTGRLTLELRGFKDENVADRMHIDIRRSDSLRWFDYWVERFEAIWQTAKEPRRAID